MNGYPKTHQQAGAYTKLGIESAVLSANPHRLIEILFDSLQATLKRARLHMENGNVVEKSNAISKALDIINQGLSSVVDKERGGAISQNLVGLYDYVGVLLIQAGRHNDTQKIDLAMQIVGTIGDAWHQIGENNRPKGQ